MVEIKGSERGNHPRQIIIKCDEHGDSWEYKRHSDGKAIKLWIHGSDWYAIDSYDLSNPCNKFLNGSKWGS